MKLCRDILLPRWLEGVELSKVDILCELFDDLRGETVFFGGVLSWGCLNSDLCSIWLRPIVECDNWMFYWVCYY